MKMRVFFAAALGSLLLCGGVPARAGETSLGLTLDATTGTHAEANGSVALPVVPVPIFTLDHREGPVALHLEGVPPLGPVGLANGDRTQLSLLDGALRLALAPRTWVGLGETIFNQRTVYPWNEVQSSRVAGARFEIGGTLWRSGARRVEVSLAASPSMRGAITDVFSFSPGPSVTTTGSERASLVDGQAAWTADRGRSTIRLGIRWINYASRFPDGSTADQNRLLSPFLGWSTRL